MILKTVSAVIPYKVLEFPGLHHSVREIGVLLSGILSMQLLGKRAELYHRTEHRPTQLLIHCFRTHMSDIDMHCQPTDIQQYFPNSFSPEPVSMVGLTQKRADFESHSSILSCYRETQRFTCAEV